jgi:energy-coupling factor transporter ATP-binding protein EcfA2
MYLKNIFIENVGGIEEFNIQEASFLNDDGNPRPIILVGTNGSGKTTVLSSIADALFELSNKVFQDILPQNALGHSYYKLNGVINQSIGKDYGFTYLQFKDNENPYEYIDKTGKITFEAFKTKTKNSSKFFQSEWKEDENCKICTDVRKTKSFKKFEKDFRENSYCFFPSDRFEYPHWLNRGNEINNLQLSDNIRHAGKLEKPILAKTSLNQIKSWILDVIVDSRCSVEPNERGYEFSPEVILGNIRSLKQSVENIEKILSKIMCVDIKFKLNYRTQGLGRLGIINKETCADIIPSLDNLSAGQSTLLSMFALIVKYSDLQDLNKSIHLDEIEGIVLIDEIDLHLHIELQKEVLPELIKSFPKVQFIMSSHSPFFLYGMDQKFKQDVLAINMPEGNLICTDDFTEFGEAYGIFKDLTSRYKKERDELEKIIDESQKTILFVEGEYDVSYLKKAGELLKKTEILNKIEIRAAGGCGKLKIIWNTFDKNKKLSEIVTQKIILLYDCDTDVKDTEKGKVFKRAIPMVKHNIIKKGIENLFYKPLLEKAIKSDAKYIDITNKTTKTERGMDVEVPEKWEINTDEKGNLCKWICKYGEQDDFEEFKKIFKIIEDIISDSRSG